nr:glycosyltransferase N-terminal domain-containing protein [Tranquillimonas alkanivorans]
MSYLARQWPELSVVVTSDAALSERDIAGLPGARLHDAPPDTARAVRQFIETHGLRAALWVGDLRPCYLVQTHRHGIRSVWADACIDPGRAWRLRWLPLSDGAALQALKAVLAAPGPEVERLAALPALRDRIETPGALQPGVAAAPCDMSERDALAVILHARPVWFAAFVDPGEVSAVLQAHAMASRLSHRLLLILHPARPEDGAALRDELARDGWRAVLRSEGEDPREETQVLVADTEDELGLWYRLATITFVGGTFAGGPTRSPLEPAALGSVVLHGPQGGAQADAFERLHGFRAAHRVAGAEALGRAVEKYLSPDAAAEMAHHGWQAVSAGADVANRLVDLLDELLNEAGA